MTEGRRCALILASYEYDDPEIQKLVGPSQDAEDLASVLKDPSIGGFEVQMLPNKTKKDTEIAIQTFFENSKRDDLLLLYFSGHGMKDKDSLLYFATKDTQNKYLRSTAVSAKFVNEIMNASRSQRQVILLDCCYSGAFIKGMAAKSDKNIDTRAEFQGRGKVVITASGAMQYTFEENERKGEGRRSIFTGKLVQGLESGEADLDRDGHVSLDDLYEYVRDQVHEEMPEMTPQKIDLEVEGEIFIARNPRIDVKDIKEARPKKTRVRSSGTALKFCPHCNFPLDAGASFCLKCGHDVEELNPYVSQICPNQKCRYPIGEGTQFCPKCGMPTQS
jgi:hypothetical protein